MFNPVIFCLIEFFLTVFIFVYLQFYTTNPTIMFHDHMSRTFRVFTDMILEVAFILVRVTAISGIADHHCSRAEMMFWMPIFVSAAGNLDPYFCTSDYTWRKDFCVVILYLLKLYCVTCHEHLFFIHNQWITSIKAIFEETLYTDECPFITF